MRIIHGRMTGVRGLAFAIAVALVGVWAWRRSRSTDCEPAVNLLLLARGKEPWMWGNAPVRYRFSVTGPDLKAEVQFDKPFTDAYGSSRLWVRQHEKGVVGFVLLSPPPRFKVALERDGARVFERELTFQNTRPCYRQTLYIDLPPSVADIVEGKNREPEAAPR